MTHPSPPVIDRQSAGVPASPSGHSPKGGAASSTASPAEPSVPNAAFLLKSWDVTVEGYGTERIIAASRGKALAKAWRCDAFGRLTFGDFLKIASAWRAMLVPADFGEPILVQGRSAFRVGRRGSYVSFVWPWEESVLNSHPTDVTAIATAVRMERDATEIAARPEARARAEGIAKPGEPQ